jgi:hypothetical protein
MKWRFWKRTREPDAKFVEDVFTDAVLAALELSEKADLRAYIV